MQPYIVVPPVGPAACVLFDSPHSGRVYPDDFGASATMCELRRAEDAYVDELIAGADTHGVVTLLASVPRCYIDLNRADSDVDPGMLVDPGLDWEPTEKSRRGLGLIRELVVPGVRVYDRKLSTTEIRGRIARCYQPYHQILGRLVREIHALHGSVVHIDWHSMKSVGNAMTPDGEGAARPDFVVGDLHGASADPAITNIVVTLLRSAGYSVAVNEPYAGGRIVRQTGDPAGGVHSVQVEINRGLYLDEVRVEKTAGFVSLHESLAGFGAGLVSAVSARRKSA